MKRFSTEARRKQKQEAAVIRFDATETYFCLTPALTLTLSPGERGQRRYVAVFRMTGVRIQRWVIPRRAKLAGHGERFSLSLEERAGVRTVVPLTFLLVLVLILQSSRGLEQSKTLRVF